MTEPVKLPDLPSDLITLALADLAKVEAMPDMYTVEMSTWHEPRSDEEICVVCLAGSIMAMTLDADPNDHLNPYDFSESNKLNAINFLRIGDVCCGLEYMRIADDGRFDRSIARYSDDPAAFRRDMEALAADLKAAGL